MPTGLTSPTHMFVIILVALIVLGPEKLPHALRQAGRTMAEMRQWFDGTSTEVRDVFSLEAGAEAPAAVPAAPALAPSADADADGAGQPATAPAPQTLATIPVSSGTPSRDPDGQPFPHPALQEGGEWH